jgi:hypothetical protein
MMFRETHAKPQKRRWLIPLGVLGSLLLTSLACVGGTREVDGFGLRRTYDLKEGEQRSGDQVILATTIKLRPESTIDGDATLIGQKVELGAEVAGDVVVVADRLTVKETAVIRGDLVMCVDNLTRENGARIDGEVKKECTESRHTSVSNLFESGFEDWQENFFVRLTSLIGGALFFGALAALSTVIVPRPLIRMSRSIRQAPVVTGGVGCLTVLVAIGLTLAYVVSLLLILPLILLPFVLLGWVLLGLLSVLGWVALAEPFGRFLFRMLHMDEQPRMVTAAIGGIALTVLVRMWSLFWFTTWIGALMMVMLGSVGLGAVVLTRLGTRSYPLSDPMPVID